jgi:hypothetical protein
MRRHKISVGVFSLLSLAAAAYADWAMIENFNGAFDETWIGGRGVMPDELTPGGLIEYAGGPASSFSTLDGAGILRMTNAIGSFSRVGLFRDEHLGGAEGVIEARVNVLAQGDSHSNFFELFLFDHVGEEFVRVGLNNGPQGERMMTFRSTADAAGSEHFHFADNSWFKLRISGDAAALRVSIFNDAGDTELAGHTFSHLLSDWGDEFHVAFGQSNISDVTQSGDVAVDYINAIPEPSAALLLLAGLAALRRR